MEQETHEVQCPSKLTGLVRALTVGDISSLTARTGKKRKRGGDPLGQMFRNVWCETTDAGDYNGASFIEVGKKISDWDAMLLGDRAFLVYAVRRLTFGNEFYFRLPCGRCREQIDWQIDLEELEITGLSDEAATALSETGIDARLYRTLPRAGVKVGFRLLQGRDQRLVEQAAREGEGAMGEAGLLARLPEIDGATSPGERRKFIRQMHLLDLEYLREQWEEADIYVQDSLEVECQSCGQIQEITIPTDARFFSQRSARPRQARRSGS